MEGPTAGAAQPAQGRAAAQVLRPPEGLEQTLGLPLAAASPQVPGRPPAPRQQPDARMLSYASPASSEHNHTYSGNNMSPSLALPLRAMTACAYQCAGKDPCTVHYSWPAGGLRPHIT